MKAADQPKFQHNAICIMREGHKLGSYALVFPRFDDIAIEWYDISPQTLKLICRDCGKNYGYAVGCSSKRTLSHGGSVTIIFHNRFSRYGIMLSKRLDCLIEHPSNDDY